MERSEPTLVPGWLKSSGSVTGGVSSAQHFASSSHSDVPSLPYPSKNRSFKAISDFENPCSTLLERSASSNSRRSSGSNASPKHPYSSFGRSNRDKDRDREKERSVLSDHWDADPLVNMLTGRDVDSTLRHSRSMVSRKQSDLFPRRAEIDSRNGSRSNHRNGNGVHSARSTGSGIQKAVFDNDFPSLGNDERQGSPDIGRVPSPGLTSVAQSLRMSNSALMSGESWSALAEVPVLNGSNIAAMVPAHHSSAATPASSVSCASPGLNMAEALAQAPSRAQNAPQASLETQRLEELAIRKSRQLIPMTPSMPKALMLNFSDKSKAKAPIRGGEMIGPTKSLQQPPTLLPTGQSVRNGQVRPEAQKTSQAGKFLVLKPARENGVSPGQKDVTCPNNGVTSKQNAVNSVASDTKSPNNINAHAFGHKASSGPLNLVSTGEKRSLSQAKSRSDFFNLMRKKSLTTTSVLPDSGSALPSPTKDKSGEVINEVTSDPVTPDVTDNGDITSTGDASEEANRLSNQGEEDLFPDSVVYPDEEEAAFLRSLGWDENAGEEDGLTEEEINAFYQECMKLRPALKMCRGMQTKLSMLSESYATNIGGAEVSSSGAKTEA